MQVGPWAHFSFWVVSAAVIGRATDSLERLMTPIIVGLGYQLVGVVEFSAGRRRVLRVYIDSVKGISLDDCEKVSRHVSDLLDVEDPVKGSYTLEVSSPGLDRPLFKPEDYVRFVGRQVKLRTRMAISGRRNFSGTLIGYDGGCVKIQLADESILIPFEEIEQARLVPDYQVS